ncbi:hypothetical protein HanIR_Chr10g0452711 [Helianthus annuus]|nr:hypothetical protein HanIR_Chr10g0452711 [Helianthus annuus]
MASCDASSHCFERENKFGEITFIWAEARCPYPFLPGYIKYVITLIPYSSPSGRLWMLIRSFTKTLFLFCFNLCNNLNPHSRFLGIAMKFCNNLNPHSRFLGIAMKFNRFMKMRDFFFQTF